LGTSSSKCAEGYLFDHDSFLKAISVNLRRIGQICGVYMRKAKTLMTSEA
jgi:hypothetical protein